MLTTVEATYFTPRFRCRREESYHYFLNEWLELDFHERLNKCPEVEVLTETVKISYATASLGTGEDAVISETDAMEKVRGILDRTAFSKEGKKKVCGIRTTGIVQSEECRIRMSMGVVWKDMRAMWISNV